METFVTLLSITGLLYLALPLIFGMSRARMLFGLLEVLYDDNPELALPAKPQKLALVIAAHNEEVVIASTIKSAIAAGMDVRDIYVADDASTDATASIAAYILGQDHVVTLKHSGKAMALRKAATQFKLTKRYDWIHIADADGVFSPDYFKIFISRLDPDKYAAATGYVQSLKGDWISKYRVYEYTWGLEVTRRMQSWMGVISVIPGPTSCFRADVFDQLDFDGGTLTEDFEITLQIHRKKLGRIAFIPEAKAFTQDPRTYRDYVGQITRWNRGIFQGLMTHRIGTKKQKIDAYLAYIIFESFLYGYVQLVYLPIMAYVYHAPVYLAIAFLNECLMFIALAIMTAARSGRWDILAAFPTFFVLRWTSLFIFYKAFYEIVVLKRFNNNAPGWSTAGRRYQIVADSQLTVRKGDAL